MNKKFIAVLIIIIFSSPALALDGSHFDRGMDHFNKGNYKLSSQEFALAVSEDPDNISSSFYYALSLYYDDKLSEAREEFKKTYLLGKTTAWGISAKQYIEVIDLAFFAPRPEDDFDGFLSFSYESDDNITYGPALVAEGLDYRYTSQVSLTYKPIFLSQRLFAFSVSGYSSTYYKNTQYNIYGGMPSVTINAPFLFDGFTALTFGSGNNYQNYEPYYSSDFAEARATFVTIKGLPLWTNLYVSGYNNLYKSSTYEVYDGYNTTIGIRQDLNPLMYLQYENESSITRGPDYANRSDEFGLGVSAPFPAYHKMFFQIKYINKFFLYEDSIGGQPRHDTSWVFDIFLSKDVIRDVTVGLRYIFTNYISNLDKTQSALGYGSYNDRVLSLSISYRF